MEKDQKILIGLIAITIIVALAIGVYFLVIRKETSSDAIKFKNEYESYNEKLYDNKDNYLKVELDEDNLYVYKNEEEIIDVLKNQTGLIYFGFAECPYCRSMVKILNDIAKSNSLETIYYVDISNIRDTYEVMNKTAVKITNGTDGYYEMLEILDEYLSPYIITEDEIEYNTGVKRLYAPTVVAVDNGEILGFHEGTIDGTLLNSPLTSEEQKELSNIYSDMITKLTEKNMCTKKKC